MSVKLEGVCVPAHAAAEGELLPCVRVLHMQGTLASRQLHTTGT